MSLNNIVIEQIKDNYYRGEFLGLNLVIDKNTGYFNASKLCRDGKKEFKDWLKNKKTKELMKYISKIHPPENSPVGGYKIKTGHKSVESNEIAGTYVCKELILDIASWISPEFYLKCNGIIMNHAEAEFKIKYENQLMEKDFKLKEKDSEIKEKDCKIDELIRKLEVDRIKMEQKIDQLIMKQEQEREENNTKHEELIDNLEDIKDKLDRSLPDRNIDPEDDDLVHYYMLLRNKQNTKEYLLLRGQDKHIESLKKKHSASFNVIIDKTKNPNPIDFGNRLKEKIKIINEETYSGAIRDLRLSTEYIKGTPTYKRTLVNYTKKEYSKIIYRLNKITLKFFSEKELLKLVRYLDYDRYNI